MAALSDKKGETKAVANWVTLTRKETTAVAMWVTLTDKVVTLAEAKRIAYQNEATLATETQLLAVARADPETFKIMQENLCWAIGEPAKMHDVPGIAADNRGKPIAILLDGAGNQHTYLDAPYAPNTKALASFVKTGEALTSLLREA